MQKTREELQSIWVTDYIPTQTDFSDLFESTYNLSDDNIISNAVSAELDNKANLIHTHEISGVNELQNVLDSKQVTGNYLTSYPVSSVNGEVGNVFITVESISASPYYHNHEISGVNHLQETLNIKADLVNGYIPINQIPDTLIGSVNYHGTYDASLNVTPSVSGGNNKGDYFVISVSGTIETVVYYIGDWIIYDGFVWEKINNSDKVSSVNGKQGIVLLTASDVSASEIIHNHEISGVNELQNTLDLKQNIVSFATTGVSGVVRLSTLEEVSIGNDTDPPSVVTPGGLKPVIDSKLPILSNIRSVSATTDIILTTDLGKDISYTAVSAVALTLPPVSGFPVGFQCTLHNDSVSAINVGLTGAPCIASGSNIAQKKSALLRMFGGIWRCSGGLS